jgi:hypothetical protein
MTAVAFDTHEAANRFKAAGFTEVQVEALVDVTRMTTALPDISTLATKGDLLLIKTDLEGVRTGLKAEISDLRTELKAEISGVRAELRTEIAGVKALIATSQVQTIAIVLTGMAALLAVSRLIH